MSFAPLTSGAVNWLAQEWLLSLTIAFLEISIESLPVCRWAMHLHAHANVVFVCEPGGFVSL